MGPSHLVIQDHGMKPGDFLVNFGHAVTIYFKNWSQKYCMYVLTM